MMTRKDYIATANILLSVKESMPKATHDFLVKEFSIMFESDNERFDTKRFEEACK